MQTECPNCRQLIPWARLFFTPAWGQWRCARCGSLLGINVRRRLLAVALLCLIFPLVPILKLSFFGYAGAWIVFIAGLVVHFLFFERARLIERTGFRCRRCGYDLRGQVQARCPECSEQFDATEPAFVQADIRKDPPPASRPRFRLGWTLLICVPLTVTLVLGVVYFKRVRARAALLGAAIPQQTAPATPQAPLAQQSAAQNRTTTAPGTDNNPAPGPNVP